MVRVTSNCTIHVKTNWHARKEHKHTEPRVYAGPKKDPHARASPSGFIKISSSPGVINARAGPWVDASVLKVKSRSHSAQPSVKRRPNPLHWRGKENAISHSIKKKKKYNIFLSPIKTSLMEHFRKRGCMVEARTPSEGCTCAGPGVYQQSAGARLHRAPSTEHRAPSTEHRAPGTEHRAPSTEHRAPPCSGWNKELIIKVTNDCAAFIAFSGIICMNFTSLVNNPFSVINKTENGW